MPDATIVAMNEDLEHRLKRAMARVQIDVAELARKTGLTYQGVKKAFDGKTKNMELDSAAAIAKVLRCNKHWLASGEGDPDFGGQAASSPSAPAPAPHEAPSPEGGEPDLVITQYDETGGSMGHGFNLTDNPPGHIRSWRVTHEWLRLNVPVHTGVKNLAIVTGFGPSMKPMFNPGDPLLVDTGVKVVDHEGVYFFRVGEEGFIKLIQRVPEFNGPGVILRVISKNPDFPPYDLSPKNPHFEVLGKVLTVWRSEQY